MFAPSQKTDAAQETGAKKGEGALKSLGDSLSGWLSSLGGGGPEEPEKAKKKEEEAVRKI